MIHGKEKKSGIDMKTWIISSITDLIIGIILILIDKTLN